MRSSKKSISRWRQPSKLRTRVDFHDIAVSLLAFSLLLQHNFLTVVVLLSGFSFRVRCCITTTSAVVIQTSVTPSQKTSLLTNSFVLQSSLTAVLHSIPCLVMIDALLACCCWTIFPVLIMVWTIQVEAC